MLRSKSCRALWLALALAAGCGRERLDGRYVAAEEAALTITLEESSDGRVTGSLQGPAGSVPLTGQRQGDGLAGTVGEHDDATPFTATVADEQVTLTFGTAQAGQTVHFHRIAADRPEVPGDTSAGD
jgi:hypothetical protein